LSAPSFSRVKAKSAAAELHKLIQIKDFLIEGLTLAFLEKRKMWRTNANRTSQADAKRNTANSRLEDKIRVAQAQLLLLNYAN
jgi:hypothetical protein